MYSFVIVQVKRLKYMCIEYNVYVKEIFVITESVHMNEKTGTGVSSVKEKVKESQSQSVTPSLDTPSGAGLGASQRPSECKVGDNVFLKVIPKRID